MLPTSDTFQLALSGSYRSVLLCDAWYDGDLIMRVPVSSAQLTLDGSRDVIGSLALTAAGEDLSIVPKRPGDALAPWGSELNIRVGMELPGGGMELLSLGWFRIDTADPRPGYLKRNTPDGSTIWLGTGATVSVAGSDRMSKLVDAKHVAASQPVYTTSVVREIARLARDLVPIGDWTHVNDQFIPALFTYDGDLVPSIQRLAAIVGQRAMADADGLLAPRTLDPGGASVWMFRADEDNVTWDPTLSRDGIYNAVITTGEGSSAAPVQGSTIESGGPFRYGGPFGRVPYERSTPTVTTAAAAQADAQAWLARVGQDRVTEVTATVLANPAIEIGDVVTIELPDQSLTGPVTKLTLPLWPLGTMTVSIGVPYSQLVPD